MIRGFATRAASDLYRDTVTNRHGIATVGFLNHLAAALHDIEHEAASMDRTPDPSWTEDAEGYVVAPLDWKGDPDHPANARWNDA